MKLKKDYALSHAQTLEYGVQIVHLLRDMHEAGYLHCDIKPDNVIGTFEDTDTLIDFGLAHRFQDNKGKHVPNHTISRFKGHGMLFPLGFRYFCSKNTLEMVL